MATHDSHSRSGAHGRADDPRTIGDDRTASRVPRDGGGEAGVPAAEGSGPTDEELLRRFRGEGDEGAFELLVHRYEQELFSYLRRYLGSVSAQVVAEAPCTVTVVRVPGGPIQAEAD